MRGWARRRGALILSLVLATVVTSVAASGGVAWAAGAAEVQVRSRGHGASAITTVSVQTSPGVHIVDRTPGAMPAAAGATGPASRGVTFGGEVTLALDGAALGREAAVDVADDLVSSVRMFPEHDGATVVVFVRRPVTYTVSQPSGAGEVTIELRGRRTTAGTAPQVRTTPGVLPGLEAPPAPPPSAEQVALDAAEVSYDRDSDTLIARGGVTLTRGEFSLRADEVRYDRTHGVAEASGNVVMSDPDATLEGDAAYVDLVDETGWIEDVNADFTLSRYVLSAGRLTKRGGPVYRVTDGIFTTCRCGGLEKPSWSIKGERTDVKLAGMGLVRNATIRVKDMPVAWLPVLAFPANNQRQTGFLMPRFGFSNRRGFQYEQPFFWAINKSADLTVGLDVETEARIGALGEFRYKLSKKAQGNFSWAYYNEAIRKPDSVRTTTPGGVVTELPQENRYIVAGHHEQPFYAKSQYYLDVFNVSDDTILREVDNLTSVVQGNLRLRSTRFTRSRTGVVKTWNGGVVQVEPAYYQDLINPQELVPQPLPKVRAEQQYPFFGGHLIGRINGGADYFDRQQGFEGARFNVAPELMVPFRWGRWVNGSVSGLVRETAYQLGDKEQIALVADEFPDNPNIARTYRAARELPRLDKTHTRETAEINARVASEVARVYDFPYFGFNRLRHSIEPEVRYLYVPEVDPQTYTLQKPNCFGPGPCTTLFSRGYMFDELDAINQRNFFSYGFTTRLLARTDRPAKPIKKPPVIESEDEREGVGTDSADDGILEGDEEDAEWEQGEDDEEDWTSAEQEEDDEERGVVRPEGDVRELLRVSLLHGVDVTRRLVGDSHFSDVDYLMQFRPIYWLGLNYSGTVNFEEQRLLAQVIGFSFRDPTWKPARNSLQVPSGVSVNYRFVEEDVNENRSGIPLTSPESLLFQNTGVDQVTGSLYLRLGEYFGLGYLSRYVFNTVSVPDPNNLKRMRDFGPGFIEQVYLFRVLSRCDCWAIDFAFQDRADTDERVARVQLTLVGLGSTGTGQGSGRNFGGFSGLQNQGIANEPLFGRHDWD